MMEFWNRLRAQISEIVAGMSPARRIAAAVILAVVVLALAYFGWQAANPPYATLFSRLTTEDAGEIVAVLRESGVPYRLADNGTTVMVPEERVYETRLTLAGQGLPRGGVVGFEVFLETALGATDFDRQVRYNMALQGELTRTIREINGVLDARVHIVMPERRLFARDERPATASVFLQLRPGFQLTANQVRGIAHLIARSVEGLQPENITIVDNWGQILSDLIRPETPGLLDGVGLASRLEVQRAYERELELRAQTMLERVFGHGRAIVRVNAELNFDMEEERQDLYEPVVRNEGIVRSSQIFEEEGTGPSGAGGIVGVDANVPGFVADAGDQTTFSRREEILNFEVNRIERVRVQAPGRVERLSVGAWIDAELEPAELQRVQDLLAAALGINETRGDSVIVDATPFVVSPFAAAVADAVDSAEEALPLAWIAAGAAAAVLLVVVFVLVRRRRAARQAAFDVVIDDEALVAVGREETEEERVRKHLRERAVELVRQNPREVAQLVKVWLTEG